MVLKAFKYRLYPSEAQKQHFIQAMGCARYIFNRALEERIDHYKETGKGLTYVSQANNLLIREKSEHDWLTKPLAQSLQQSLRHLDTAYKNFFREKKGFPRFKSKHDNHHSLQYPQGVKVDWKSSKTWIPKCGWVLSPLNRKFEGTIKTCTVSKTPTGKFFISILVETPDELPIKFPVLPETTIGIDLGIKHFAILSDGQKFNNPQHLRKTLKQLAKAQRALVRKEKGSKNRTKARLKVALVYERISNQRDDFLHQLSHKLLNSSDIQTVVLEDFSVANMMKNHHLALSIVDCGWGSFKRMLSYKAEWRGKNLILIDRFDPSSKMCSCCGWINQSLSLSDREWHCTKCNAHHDRDINAAINIRKLGLTKSIQSGQELPVEPACPVRDGFSPKGKIEMPGRKKQKLLLRTGSKKQEIRDESRG